MIKIPLNIIFINFKDMYNIYISQKIINSILRTNFDNIGRRF